MFRRMTHVQPQDTLVMIRRYLAHVIDNCIYILGYFLVILFVAPHLGNAIFVVLLIGGLTVGPVGYYVLLQRGSGRTPGKRVAGIRVVSADYSVPTTRALLKRSLPLLLEYVQLIALIFMYTSPYRQRLGDRWAGTFVVRA